MKRTIAPLTIIAVIMLSFFYSCSEGTSEYIGTWRRMPEGDSLYRGFTLGGNGIAASLNQTETQYNAWHRKRDTLWLSGKRFCDTAVTPFTDTLIVKKKTDRRLVVLHNGTTLEYERE